MKAIKFLTLAIICVLIFSCKKNKDTAAPSKTYLSKQTFASLGTYSFNYDAQNRLQTVVFASADEASNPSYTYKVNSFDSENRIADAVFDYVSAARNDIRTINTYDASGNLLRQQDLDYVTGQLVGAASMDYSVPGEVKVTQYTASNTVLNYTVYKVVNGNVTERKQFNAAGVLLSSDVYSNFDTKLTASSLYPVGYSRGPFSKNNYGTDVFTNAAGTSTTFTYTYEANADGYTTKRTSAGGSINTYEYIKR